MLHHRTNSPITTAENTTKIAQAATFKAGEFPKYVSPEGSMVDADMPSTKTTSVIQLKAFNTELPASDNSHDRLACCTRIRPHNGSPRVQITL